MQRVQVRGKDVRRTPEGDLAVVDVIAAVRSLCTHAAENYWARLKRRHAALAERCSVYNFSGNDAPVGPPDVVAAFLRCMEDVSDSDSLADDMERLLVSSETRKRKRLDLLNEVTTLLVRAADSQIGSTEYRRIRDVALELIE